MKIKTASPNLSAFFDRLDKRADGMKTDKQLLVGVPESAGTEDSGISIAKLAWVHEFGAEIKHPRGHTITIPQRSFLRAPLKANLPEYRKAFAWFVNRAAQGKTTMDKAMGQLGMMMVRDSQEAISKGIDPANADSTIRRKGSSTPLIDTGRLRQSITWRVVDEGEES